MRVPVILSGMHWKFYSTVDSYCCDTAEGKNMSVANHGVTSFPRIRCSISKEDISSQGKGKWWSRAELEVTYDSNKEYLDTAEALQKKEMKASTRVKRALSYLALDQHSLNKVGFMLQSTDLTHIAGPNDHYSIFSVALLHLLNLGTSKKIERMYSVLFVVSGKENESVSPKGVS